MTARNPFSPEKLASDAAQGKLTPAMARWLKNLYNGDGPHAPVDAETFENCRCARLTRPWAGDDAVQSITPAGLAALEAYDRQQEAAVMVRITVRYRGLKPRRWVRRWMVIAVVYPVYFLRSALTAPKLALWEAQDWADQFDWRKAADK